MYMRARRYLRTAIFEATGRNNEAIVRDLINQGAQCDLPDAQGRSALHQAAYFGHMNMVRGHRADSGRSRHSACRQFLLAGTFPRDVQILLKS